MKIKTINDPKSWIHHSVEKLVQKRNQPTEWNKHILKMSIYIEV